MSCTLTDEGNTSIDTFQVTAAATPTPPQMTVTATVTPVRPALVQTDFVEEEERFAARPLGDRAPDSWRRRCRAAMDWPPFGIAPTLKS